MDKILTASDKYGSFDGMMQMLAHKTRKRLPADRKAKGAGVVARVNLGRWIADCPCGGAEMVDPDVPLFFCFSCGNLDNGGKYRPVNFPAWHKSIEAELLKRKAVKVNSFIQPLHGELPREWIPGEKVSDLKAQRKSAKAGK
jgi:hypothetical protein